MAGSMRILRYRQTDGQTDGQTELVTEDPPTGREGGSKKSIKSWTPDSCRCELCKTYVLGLGYTNVSG